MKITFGRFFRNTPATIMRCGLTFRLARTHPARARSSGSEILSRSRSLVGYTIDTHESEVFGSHREAARARMGIVELTRIGFAVVDQLLDRLPWRGWMH